MKRQLINLIILFNVAFWNILGISCSSEKDHKTVDEKEVKNQNKNNELTIFLVPLDNISDVQLDGLKRDLIQNFTDSAFKECIIEKLDNVNSPDTCLNDLKTRLSAKRLIWFLENNYGPVAEKRLKNEGTDSTNYYIIGVTNRDIATAVHGKKDFGILGLSYLGGHKASIISTYRLKNGKDLWKLALHEFAHGYFRAPHCPKDDPACILQDAKGGNPHFELKKSLCEVCLSTCDPSK